MNAPRNSKQSWGGGRSSQKRSVPKSAREPVEKISAEAPYGYKKNGTPRKWPTKGGMGTTPTIHTCCGSKGPRHLSACTAKPVDEMDNKDPYKFTHKKGRPPAAAADTEDELETEDLRCGDCEKQFSAVYLDAACPDCASTTVYKMPI